jgi:hypothetical protein
MARKKKSDADKEAAKLARREKKKAERKALKSGLTEAMTPEPTARKRKKGEPEFKIIEVASDDKAGLMKLSQFREIGAIHIRQVAWASPYFLFEVPYHLKGFELHGTGNLTSSNGPEEPQRPTKTVADLVAIVKERIENKEKINKRQIKLLVRGSELKRNQKKDALTTILKQFKIK